MQRPKVKLCVLIVDDEDDMCWALRTVVAAEGHATEAARSAREALHLLEKETFDLAFVDMKLPDMEGLELATHLRRRAAGLPCVLVSGFFYGDDAPIQAALKSGLINGFIGKPFLLEQVYEALAAGRLRLNAEGARPQAPEEE